jgi:hypothetical protein
LLETYYQLRESGQIDSTIGFTAFIAFYLNPEAAAAFVAVASQPMPETAAWEQQTVDEMIENYRELSIPNNNKIFIVSHSQGNLFANRVYDSFIKDEGLVNRFANIQVASPADHVAAKWHDYITLNHDKVVGYIPDSMSGNVDEDHWWQYAYINHNFIDCYLTYKEPSARIVRAIRNLKNRKNGDGTDGGGCTYNPHARHFDVMLVLMSLLSFLYPLYHGGLWIRRRYR